MTLKLPRRHSCFSFQSETLDVTFLGKLHWWPENRETVYSLNPAGFAHSRHLMRHILWFRQSTGLSFSVAIFSVCLFQLPPTQHETRVNIRMKCDNIETEALFPLLYPPLHPLRGDPFPHVFILQMKRQKRGLKPVIKRRCGVLHKDECHHERHFTEVIPANRQFERPQQQLNSVSPHSSLKRHSGEPSL